MRIRFIDCILIVIAAFFSSDLLAEDGFNVERLEKRVVVAGCHDPMQLEVLSDGRVLFIERRGAVKMSAPGSHEGEIVGEVPVAAFQEVGLLGLACDRSFDETGWIYLFYCPSDRQDVLRLSRFTLTGQLLDLTSERTLLEYPIDLPGANHMGGGLWMDSHGDLLLGTGDNCTAIPELPVDWRPEGKNFDAMRSSADSMDLRGKILRIHPESDGTYSIPAGNLFADPKVGRPEIFVMGCRNAFRVTVDEQEGSVYWGDVGPNIQVDLGIGPNGYDEINRAGEAGNFGWPMFIGPNENYRRFDFATRQPCEEFEVDRPINVSPNNKGLRELPRPIPAIIWYPSSPSDRFPTTGSGGRSAMAGPVYRSHRFRDSPLRLHDRYDGRLFIYDWTRNWVQSVEFNDLDEVQLIEPFLPDEMFRKPMDMKFGPDGALYIIEYGDRWFDNSDGQIVRVVYRRGNRQPQAAMTVSPNAGRDPLDVRLNGLGSVDPDGDELQFRWEIDGDRLPQQTAAIDEWTFDTPGRHHITLTVTDPAGESSQASADVRVGNAPPRVKIVSPSHGSLIDVGQHVRYQVLVDDFEDGSTADRGIASRRVLLTRQFQSRRHSMTGLHTDGTPVDAIGDPGLKLMRQTTCFSCHTTGSQSAGPPYVAVGRKYVDDATARERLAKKIIAGGAGVWSNKPMPPHPQHTLEQSRLMVDWILSLAQDEASAPSPGTRGFFRVQTPPSKGENPSGVIVLTAEYTDDGVATVEEVYPLRSEDHCVLHLRRKRAASFDRQSGVTLVDVFEHGAGLVARFTPGDWIVFEEMDLKGISRVSWSSAAVSGVRGQFTIHIDSPVGPEIARIAVDGQSDELGEIFRSQTTPLLDPGGLHDLYVVAEQMETAVGDPLSKSMSLAWLEFHDSPAAQARKEAEESEIIRIVLVPTTQVDDEKHQMAVSVCRLLSACLNENSGVEAVVSTESDWAQTERALDDADAVVLYMPRLADRSLEVTYHERLQPLLARGIGLSMIGGTIGTDVDRQIGRQSISDDRSHDRAAEDKIAKCQIHQVLAEHPINRGWQHFILEDHDFLDDALTASGRPIVKAHVDGTDATVAWIDERDDGGRSFCTTLGHALAGFSVPEFRRTLVNGILWTARADIPTTGAFIELDPEWHSWEEPSQAIVREWTLDDLLPLIDRTLRPSSIASGRQHFERASCHGCHLNGDAGQGIGPDLQDVQVRMAERPNIRAALLREILEPSHTISEKYRTQILLLNTGEVVTGIVLGQHDGRLRVATNPNHPDRVSEVREGDIEERRTSDVSMMPAGLVNILTDDEILDLLAYLEFGDKSPTGTSE